MSVCENYLAVEEKVKEACRRAGRNRDEVTLIAVSKTKPMSMIEELLPLGVVDFGENKVQELTAKEEALPSGLHWHMIGHLQRNKVKYIVDKAYLIHSVDSLRLAEAVSQEAVKKGVTANIPVKGLMTIAPFVENAEENREVFRNLRKLSVDIEEKKFNNVTMAVLSMGMTGDYEVAIEEGATMVRVGTGIFGERDYSK